MAPLMIYIINISFITLIIILIFRFIEQRQVRTFIAQLVVILLSFIMIYFFFYTQPGPTIRGSKSDDIYLIIVLYISMLLGMFAHYFFSRLSNTKKARKKFDLGLFIAPFFASPIIFLPLLATL